MSDDAVARMISKGERPDLPQAVLGDKALTEIVTGCWAVEPKRRLTMNDVCVKLGLVSHSFFP